MGGDDFIAQVREQDAVFVSASRSFRHSIKSTNEPAAPADRFAPLLQGIKVHTSSFQAAINVRGTEN